MILSEAFLFEIAINPFDFWQSQGNLYPINKEVHMIGSLTGILKEVSITEIHVDVNGVGYIVFIPMSTYDKLPKKGEKIEILTYLHVLDDDLRLYGFANKQDKDLFKLLMSVSGIGPKLALNVLSSISPSSFCAAINNADMKMLSRINGIGKKTAERMVLELKSKVALIAPETAYPGKVPDATAKAAEDSTLALVQLGFKYDAAAKAIHELIKTLPPAQCNSENLIRNALKSLNS